MDDKRFEAMEEVEAKTITNIKKPTNTFIKAPAKRTENLFRKDLLQNAFESVDSPSSPSSFT